MSEAEVSVAKLQEENCRLKESLDACLQFMECEMRWEYFRADMLCLDDEPQKCISMENARKLKNFLIQNGYKP